VGQKTNAPFELKGPGSDYLADTKIIVKFNLSLAPFPKKAPWLVLWGFYLEW
jgi:hypothetical protein